MGVTIRGKNTIVGNVAPSNVMMFEGPQGPQGEVGPQGEAFTYEDFTPEQLEALRGPRGLQGPAGPKGDPGTRGPQGIRGVQGLPGPVGPRGNPGPRGPQGDQGIRGIQGLQGPAGYTPVRGKDYWTEDDKTEIIREVSEQIDVPSSGGNVDLTGYATEQYVKDYAQPKGGYLTAVPDEYAKTADIPTKPSDIGAQPEGDYALRSEIPSVPVKSVNGKTGAVSLSASDVKARPDTWMPSASDVGALPNTTKIPAKTSDLTNDSGFITGYTETDPTVPAWAKNATKPSYSKSEVGLGNVENVKQYSASNPPPYPVTSVNGKTGAVTVTVPTVPTKVSAFTNDAGYLTQHQDISGKLDASALPTAIDTALAQAKASGEFDGATGQRGTGLLSVTTEPSSYTTAVGGITPKYRMALSTIKTQAGVTEVLLGDTVRYSYYQYPIEYLDASYAYCTTRISVRGATGTSVTVKSVSESTADGGSNVVTFSDGKTLTVKNGSKGSTGAKGADGYTPQKNVDYFDGKDGKDGLDATPVTPLFANSIEECTDTTKLYVLPDGFIYAYQYVEATGPSYTNLAGTITYDKRLSSSGKVSSSAMVGACYTDFIPVKKGDIVRIKNLNIYDNLSSSAYPYICFYTGASESNVTTTSPVYIVPDQHVNAFNGLADTVSGGVASWTAFVISITGTTGKQHTNTALTHIRISGKYFADKEVIVTVNEEIKEGGSAGGYAWVNTGHAFVPADYEDRILALEDHADAIPESRIKAIEAALNEPAPADYSGNILYGKKWVACGDSFTANGYNASDGFDESVYIYQDGRFAGRYKVYPNIIGLRNNMDIVNFATGGQTMADSSNSFMTRYATIPSDADYITIMLGINDKVQGLAVGTLEDSTNTTFCGAFNIAMEHILENHPFAHVGIMVSHGTNEEIMEATRGIAERWGVPYLDYGSPQVPLMNRYTGRNVCAKAQEIRERNFCVISDGTTATNGHPNTAAHEYESTFIEAWLRTL